MWVDDDNNVEDVDYDDDENEDADDINDDDVNNEDAMIMIHVWWKTPNNLPLLTHTENMSVVKHALSAQPIL